MIQGSFRAILAGLIGAAALAGCAPQQGAQAPGGPGAAGIDSDGRLIVEAGGRHVVVAPPAGLCVELDGVQREAQATFVLIEDCAWAGEPAPAAGDEPLVMRGLVMLSIGDGPLFDPEGGPLGEQMEALGAYLRSSEGRAGAGMGGRADQVRVLDTRRLPGTLYILVEDEAAASPLLGERIWRAFTELQGRAAIASLGVFETAALGDEAKLAHLARVVAALRMANGDAVSPEGAQLALAAPLPARRPDRRGRVNAGGVSAPFPAPRP